MNIDEATISAITGALSGGPPPGSADSQQPGSGPDPSVIAALQGGFRDSPVNQRMYSPPAPPQDSYTLPPAIAQAVQTGFASGSPLPAAAQPQVPSGSVPSGVAQAVQNGFAPAPPVGLVDGLGAPGSPQYAPPAFHPQPLADPFPDFAQYAQQGFAHGAAPSRADVAAAKETIAAQASDARAQVAQAKYDATPQGEDDAALRAGLGVNADQQALVGQQGDLEAQAAIAEAAVRDKALREQAELQAKQDAAREANLAQQKQMIDQRGKDIEAAVKRVPDPNRFYNSLSTMQHIGVGLMTLLSGAGMGLARDNGPNPVVKMMTDAQDKDIDAQKAGIEQGNKAIDAKRQLEQDYGHLGDDENAMWTYRKAQSRLMLADQIEATAAQYKAPKALIAAKMAADGLRAEAAKMVEAQAGRRLAQQNKDKEIELQRQQVGIAGGHLALAGKEFDLKKEEFQQTRQDKKDAQKEAEEARKELAEEKAALKTAAKGKVPEGGILNAAGEPATNKDGSPYTGIPKDMYKDVYEQDSAFKKGLSALDQLRQLREDSGGHINSHSTGARAAAQQMARLTLNVHKVSGVRFNEQAMDLANKVVSGDADAATVDSYLKTVEPQLDQFRQDFMLDHALSLPNFNGDIKQFMYPDPVKNKPAESGNSKFMRQMEERTGGSTLGDAAARQSATERAAAAAASVPTTGNVLADRDARQRAYEAALADQTIDKPGEQSDTQTEFIKMATKAIASGDAKAKATTIQMLEQATEPGSAVPKVVRDQLEALLYKARGYGKVTKDPDEKP